MGIFGYLILMIFIKWVLYGANLPDPYSEHCAPNLLITFINMMLNKKAEVDMKMDGCHVGNKYLEVYMYPGQAGLQSFLVMFGVLMIPIMLLGKPAFILYQRRQRRAAYGTLRDELLESDHGGQQAEEEGFGEIMINQGIHTIEYVLGSVSHTASYLRLWALSLAHAQLSEVLWSMVMRIGLSFTDYPLGVLLWAIFAAWATLTVCILCLMEGLSAFLHTLRLHWVEFNSKFYAGAGYLFIPFSFEKLLKDAEDGGD